MDSTPVIYRFREDLRLSQQKGTTIYSH